MKVYSQNTDLIVPVRAMPSASGVVGVSAPSPSRSMAAQISELSECMDTHPLMMFDTRQPDVVLAALETAASSRQVLWVGVNALDHWRANYLISPDVLGRLKFDSTAPHIWRRTTDRGKAAITAARLAGKERGAAEWQACEGGKVIRHWSEGMIRLWVLDEDKEMLRGVDWDLMIVPIGG